MFCDWCGGLIDENANYTYVIVDHTYYFCCLDHMEAFEAAWEAEQ